MPTLTVYLTPPQMERKAAQEARQAGHRAYVPTEPKTYQRGSKSHTRRVPSVRGYLFSEGKPTEAKYIKASIGTVTRQAITQLYIRTSKTQRAHRYTAGDRVMVKRGHLAEIPATVVRPHCSGWYELAVDMLGKTCLIRISEPNIHPHT
jgi:transcription antitermination factor NusG